MRSRGKGWFVNDYDVIYVQGTVEGKFYRKSTNKKATKQNEKWIEKNYRDVLLKIIANESQKAKDSIWFIEFAEEVLELSKHERNKAGQKDLEGKLKNHIKPYFKNFKISDIKPLDIERWQSGLLKTHSTGHTKKCRDLVKRVLKSAVGNELILKNPCEFAKSISVTHKKTVCYTEEEAKLMIDGAEGWFKVFLLVAFSTGLRVGEVMGLKWNDINFENGYIDLNRSITKGVHTEARDTRHTTRGKIKNHEREVELLPDVTKVLMGYYENRKHNEWLFVNKYSKPYYDSKSILKYHLKPLLEKVQVPYKQLKATRHSFITMMVNNGFEKTWVKEMVGHAPRSTVLDEHYYTYERNEDRLKTANNFFFNKKKKAVKIAE